MNILRRFNLLYAAAATVILVLVAILFSPRQLDQVARQTSPTTIVVTIPIGDTTATDEPLAAQALKIGTSFFQLSIEVSDIPVGPRLGGFDLPGTLHFYLNLTARLFWMTLLHGYIEFT